MEKKEIGNLEKVKRTLDLSCKASQRLLPCPDLGAAGDKAHRRCLSVRQPRYRIPLVIRDLDRWLCVLSFRRVCLYRVLL